MTDPQAKLPPLRWETKLVIGFTALAAIHALTLLVAAYTWVIVGKKFPPFAKFDDGIFLFAAMTAACACGAFMAGINPGCDGRWRNLPND